MIILIALMVGRLRVNGLIMAGGKGRRIGDPLKFFRPLGDKTVIDVLIDDVKGLVDRIYVCGGKILHTHEWDDKVTVVETPGDGYVNDLGKCLRSNLTMPVLVLPADLFILDLGALHSFVRESLKGGDQVVSFLQDGELIGISLFKSAGYASDQLRYRNYHFSGRAFININTEEDYSSAVLTWKRREANQS